MNYMLLLTVSLITQIPIIFSGPAEVTNIVLAEFQQYYSALKVSSHDKNVLYNNIDYSQELAEDSLRCDQETNFEILDSLSDHDYQHLIVQKSSRAAAVEFIKNMVKVIKQQHPYLQDFYSTSARRKRCYTITNWNTTTPDDGLPLQDIFSVAEQYNAVPYHVSCNNDTSNTGNFWSKWYVPEQHHLQEFCSAIEKLGTITIFPAYQEEIKYPQKIITAKQHNDQWAFTFQRRKVSHNLLTGDRIFTPLTTIVNYNPATDHTAIIKRDE